MIRRLSLENPLWGAPRVHGELLKHGYEVAEATVGKNLVKSPGPARPNLAHIPAQPPLRDRRHRLLHRADRDLQDPVCLCGPVDGPTPDCTFQRHRLADGSVDKPAADLGVSLRVSPEISDP